MRENMFRCFMLLSLFLIFENGYANSPDFNAAFKNGMDTASSHKNNPFNAINTFHPENTFKTYTSHPLETHYYEGVTQKDTTLSNDSAALAKTDISSKTIHKSFETRPQYPNISDTPYVKYGKNIQSDAIAIVNGHDGQFIDCTKPKTCQTTYVENTCEENRPSTVQSCDRTLIIDVIPHQIDTHFGLGTRLSVRDHNYAEVNINVVTGSKGFIGPHDTTFWLDGRLPPNLDCNTLHGRITSSAGNAHLDNISFPACSNGLVLHYHISNGHRLDLSIDIVSTTITYELRDRWVDSCGDIASIPYCNLQEESCVEGPQTRSIQGISVARDCWKKKVTYACGASTPPAHPCQALQNQGCSETGSTCLTQVNDTCLVYQQTYQCPIEQCQGAGSDICNHASFCLSGDCVSHNRVPDPNFEKGVAGLSAIDAASKQFDPTSGFIFTGHKASCDNDFIGFEDCCRDAGWGVDMHLAHCDTNDQKLGKAKEDKLTVYVGEYCSNEVLGICTSHRKSYCVFDSKISQIIQDQGRNKQLGISFGNGENPDCRGMTPDELQKIDFSKIDFGEFEKDLMKQIATPNQAKTTDQINARIEELIAGGHPHE